MTYFIRKIPAALALLLIISIGPLYGDFCNSSVCQKDDCYFSWQPECNFKGFIIADFLYWKAFESGLDEFIPDEDFTGKDSHCSLVSKLKGKSHDPYFKWDPGFRIAAGYVCNNWDVVFTWSHFNSHTSASTRKVLRWNIDFNVIDTIAGYEAELSPCFALRPFAGLRTAKIDQKIRTGGSHRHSSDFSGFFERHKHNYEDFAGIGPLLGLDTNWSIGQGFSFYASASFSWLYGNLDIKFLEDSKHRNIDFHYHIKKHLNAIISAADAALGIRWQTCFYNDAQFVLQLGLEHHCYFDYNRLGSYGDLSFDGFNFSAGIAY